MDTKRLSMWYLPTWLLRAKLTDWGRNAAALDAFNTILSIHGWKRLAELYLGIFNGEPSPVRYATAYSLVALWEECGKNVGSLAQQLNWDY